ncbi:hypothetical protein NLJ89_g2452 [Agrocybe chaxingu]|uniref:Uncharacterized protein n=1 Tax=Agrocybe chaxingu TaxID=84603 RepID=A0A9W8K6K5_9AGAR|nr:hypothetical protein NLJ89_g2452 [Agrocybe chaxingu]
MWKNTKSLWEVMDIYVSPPPPPPTFIGSDPDTMSSFFENASNITIKGTSISVVNGGMEVFDNSRHTTNVNSFNTTSDTAVDSYNDNSRRYRGTSRPGSPLRPPSPHDRPRSAGASYGRPHHLTPDYRGDPNQRSDRGHAGAHDYPTNWGPPPPQPSPWIYGQPYPYQYPGPPPQHLYPYHQYGYPPPGAFYPSPNPDYAQFPQANDRQMFGDVANDMGEDRGDGGQETRKTKRRKDKSRHHRKEEPSLQPAPDTRSEVITQDMSTMTLVDESRPEFSRVKSDPQNPIVVDPVSDGLTTSHVAKPSGSAVVFTETPQLSPSPAGPSSKIEKSPKPSRISKALEIGAEGGNLLLTLVQEAARFAPIPYLQLAADTTLKIVNTVQAVKGNQADFKQLAQDSTELIAVVWRSYQKASDPEAWAKEKLEMVESFVTTLHMILAFVEDQVDRNVAVRVIFSVADAGKIKALRERLHTAVEKFEVSSHLSIQDMLQEVLDGQKEIVARLEKQERYLVTTSRQGFDGTRA